MDIYCGDTHPTHDKVCTLRNNPVDEDGPQVTPFATTTVERGWFYNTYSIVLCPRFFEEKTSLEYILYHTTFGDKDENNATEYKFSWGHTIYHELAHADPVIAGFETFDPAYRACDVAKLAYQNGCSGDIRWVPKGWTSKTKKPNTLINADSYAFFASGVYFQNMLKLSQPATAEKSCDITKADDSQNVIMGDPEGYLLDPVNRTDGTYYAKQPTNPAPENTPPDDPPTAPVPYTGRPLPTDLAMPFAPGEAQAYFATYQASDSSATTVAMSTTLTTSTTKAPAPSPSPADVSCNCAYDFLFDQFTVSGKNFPADKLDLDGTAGAGLEKQLKGCGALTDYKFQTLTNDPSGMQWKATGRLPIGVKACVGRAVQTVGGDSPDKCTGAG